MTSSEAVSGVYAAAITPLGADLHIDPERFKLHCQWLLANGCDGLAPLGSAGESNSLALADRLAVPGLLRDAGIPANRIILGTGSSSLADAIAITRAALESGYSNVLTLPPFFYKDVSEDGVFAYYAGILAAVPDPQLRLFLYHFPRMSGVPITTSLIARLRAVGGDRIAGLKDSGGDFAHTRGLIESFSGFRVFSGSEEFLADNLGEGGAGAISATTNVTAPLAARLRDTRAPGYDVAVDELKRVRRCLQAYPLSAMLKQLLAWRNADGSWNRVLPPLVTLSPEAAARLHREAMQFEFFREGFVVGEQVR
jgi:4-hydroxy-tetrahydrodipicolinate synthase